MGAGDGTDGMHDSRSRLGRLFAKLSYANVMATVAVFIALSGAAWAVTALPKNSVGTKQIKKNAVKSKKVKDGSLLSKDFKAGQLPAGKTGPQGPKGATGATGPSDTYFSSTTTGGAVLTGPNTQTTLESLSLPAGSYLVTGEATIDNGEQTGSGYATCALVDPVNQDFAFGTTGLGPNSDFNDQAEVALTGVVTLTNTGTVKYSCGYGLGNSDEMTATQRHIFATAVGSLHGQ